MFRILTGRSKYGRWLQGLLACIVFQAAAVHAATIELAATQSVIAIAYDGTANRLYFLDQSGALNRMELTPDCERVTIPCKVSTIVANGLGQPQDLAVNGAAGLAYVINRAGALMKVDLNSATPVPVTVATELGIAKMVLAPEINAVFVSETRGSLSRIDLSTGQKTFITHVTGAPQALAVNAARTFAYVSNGAGGTYNPGTITEVDLATGKSTRTFGNFGFYGRASSLAWADSSEHALYALSYNLVGTEDLRRMDLMTSSSSLLAHYVQPIGPTPGPNTSAHLPQALAVNPWGSGIYLGTDISVIRFPLVVEPTGQVFLSIGKIPIGNISSGYATTSSTPGAVFSVTDAPFGGTLDIFGNLTLLRTYYGAASYKVLVKGPNDPNFSPILTSWTTLHWNKNLPLPNYEPVLVAPVNAGGAYSIPKDYDYAATAPYWLPTYLMMRWPTSDYGLYTLQIQIFSDVNGTQEIKDQIPQDQQTLTVMVDNTPPVVSLNQIRLYGSATVVGACEIISLPEPNLFDFDLTVSDPNAHLLNYSLRAFWGRNQSETILSGSFGLQSTELPPGPNPVKGWSAHCNCAHTFALQATKRTIDGNRYTLSGSSSESITINNAINVCQ